MKPTPKCECADPGCDSCGGECPNDACTTLFRVDMQDLTGTAMCQGCSDDAMESGLFREEDDELVEEACDE